MKCLGARQRKSPVFSERRAFRIFDKKVKPYLPLRGLRWLDPRKKNFPRIRTAIIFELAARRALIDAVPKNRQKQSVVRRAIKQMAGEILSGRSAEPIMLKDGKKITLTEIRVQQIMGALDAERNAFERYFGRYSRQVSEQLDNYLKQRKAKVK